MAYEFNNQQKQAIEELKDHIITIAYSAHPSYCDQCIDTIHTLLGILTMLTDDEDREFAKEVYSIIGVKID